MFYGQLLMGGTLVFFAFWLQRTESRGWPNDSFNEAEDQAYLRRRGKSRRLVNILIGICGLLSLCAAISGDRLVFVSAWSIITLNLLVIIVLAGLDAFRTFRHHTDKLRRIREQTADE